MSAVLRRDVISEVTMTLQNVGDQVVGYCLDLGQLNCGKLQFVGCRSSAGACPFATEDITTTQKITLRFDAVWERGVTVTLQLATLTPSLTPLPQPISYSTVRGREGTTGNFTVRQDQPAGVK